jgi:hypothetical protein
MVLKCAIDTYIISIGGDSRWHHTLTIQTGRDWVNLYWGLSGHQTIDVDCPFWV